MRRTDSLFQLIKALNRADKRNFKLLTQLTSGTKKYIRLFDAIDRQDIYDEQKIIRQFKTDAMVKQFSVTKNYLYHNILKSLSYFEKSPFSDLSTAAVQVQSLIDKNLLPHAKKLLRKTKVQAEKQEDFQCSLRLLVMERQVLLDEQDFKHYDERIKEIQAAETLVRKRADNLQTYRHLLDQMIGIITESQQARRGDDLERVRTLIAHPFLVSEEAALSSRAKIIYLIVLRYYNAYLYDFTRVVELDAECLQIFESSVSLRDDWVEGYVDAQERYARGLLVVRQVEAAKDVISNLGMLTTRSEKATVSGLEKYHFLRLRLALLSGNVSLGDTVLREIGAALPNFQGRIRKSAELRLYYYSAWMSLVAGQKKEALRWINFFLNGPRTEVRQDLQCYARLANLIIHYELGNYDLVEHNLKSTFRFIFKRNRMFLVERLALRTIKQLMRQEKPEGTMKTFHELASGLEALVRDRFEYPAVKALLLEAWAKSKIEGRRLADILHADYNRGLEGAKLLLPTVED